jgi:hypothetical protein
MCLVRWTHDVWDIGNPSGNDVWRNVMLLVSFYVMFAPSSSIFVYLALYALSLQCHLQQASQYEYQKQDSFLLGWRGVSGQWVLTFRGNLMSSQGVDRSLNNSRTLRPITEEPILLVTEITNKMQLCRIIYCSLTTCFERYRSSSGASKL